jgi:hypothetical protein
MTKLRLGKRKSSLYLIKTAFRRSATAGYDFGPYLIPFVLVLVFVLALLVRNVVARAGVIARVVGQVFFHLIAGNFNSVWVVGVVAHLAFVVLGIRRLCNQSKDHRERN